VIVNRVATARRCFARLAESGIEVALLTGRVRPAERDAQMVSLLPRVEANRRHGGDELPLIVVATQTIEVGADFDFDALVTECASLSALRQRFGRLDRLGRRSESSAVIVYRDGADRNDPVYGNALADTWDWLGEQALGRGGVVDFGLAAFEDLLAAAGPPPAEPERHAASLLPAHLGLLAQTGPFAPQLELGAWLHGPTDRAPDVTLVWRADLDEADPASWPQAVQWLPPMLREGMPMPVAAVRRWLTGGKPADQWGDAEASADDATTGPQADRQVLCWRGLDDCTVVPATEIRPGDTLVLPSTLGGCDAWGWAPDSTAAVDDLADQCLAERLESGATRRIVLRLTAGRWRAFGAAADDIRSAVEALQALEAAALLAEDDLTDDIEQARQDLIGRVRQSGHPLAALLRDVRVERHPAGVVLRGLGTEEVDGAIETGCAVPLDQHHADVARWAAHLAAGDPHVRQIVDAAAVHDAGKAEKRMQALLHGSAVRAAEGVVLAKSALRRRDEQIAAWQTSGLPKGFRHEFASLDFATIDDGLTRHLTATHHGFGRPWLVPCQDPLAAGARFAALDSHWLQHWADTLHGNGPYALARMEWLLRTADARASIEEAEAQGDSGDGRR
jgi:CRISPR-associated endonuclease/helicase Cas3